MAETERRVPARVSDAVRNGAKNAVKTIWFLLKIIVPVTLIVAILGWSGILEVIAKLFQPAMKLIGLPGDAALVFISALLLNNYSAIAVAGTLSLDMRQVTILAIMCLTAHNLVVETSVMRKASSSGTKMSLLRFGAAILAGWAFNLLLPLSLAATPFSAGASANRLTFGPMLAAWALSTGKLAAKLALIVLGIMIVQRLLEEFGVMNYLSRLFAPLMAFFGLPSSASFLWIVINLVGYAYGAGIVVEQVESGRMKPQDADLFNHHAAVCHSLLEDSALFLALGVSLFWLTVPRLVMAAVVVWFERARRHWVRRSFRIGVN